MKSTFLLILGYFLYVQAGLGFLIGFGNPEKLVMIWLFSGIIAWFGYEAIKKARSIQKSQPVLETQKLPEAEPIQTRTTAGLKIDK